VKSSFGQGCTFISQPANQTICEGNTAVFSVSVSETSNFQWQESITGVWTDLADDSFYSGALTGILTISNVDISFNNKIYRCFITGACKDSTHSAILNVDPTTIGGSISDSATICQGSSTGTLTLSGQTGSIQKWQKKLNTGTWTDIINTASTYTETPASAGTWKYRAVVKSGTCNSVNSDSAIIIVKPTPNLTSPTSQPICSGDNTGIVYLTTDLTGTTINWFVSFVSVGVTGFSNNPSSPSSIIPIQTLYNSTTSSGTVHYTISTTATNGCIGNNPDYIITVNPLPNADAGPNVSICSGSSTTLNASGGNSYSWTPNIGSGSNPIVSPIQTTTYTVTAGNIYGCYNTDNIIVTVNPLPTVHISGSDTICKGESSNLFASGGINYTWTPTTRLDFPYSPNPVASPTHSIVYTVTVTDANNCSKEDNVRIIVDSLPIAHVNDTTICQGSIAHLYATGGTKYKWSTGDSTSNIMVSPLITSNYTVSVFNTFGCSESSISSVIVNQLPITDAGSDLSICYGASANLNATAGGIGTSYHWVPVLPNSPNPTVNPNITTTYSLTMINSFGCSNSDKVTVTVNPLPIVHISGNDSICKGESTNLFASGGINYTWTPTTGLDFPYYQSPIASPTNSTIYTVTVTDANNCSKEGYVRIIVDSLPIVNVANASICFGDTAHLTASPGTSYIWNTGDTSNNIAVSPLINTNYTVTVFNAYGCSDFGSTTVIVHPLPIADAGSDLSICNGSSSTLDGSGGSLYHWSPTSGLNYPDSSNTEASPDITTSYTLTVINSFGCIDTDSTTVFVYPIPNPVITGDSTQLCRNSYWEEYSVPNTSNGYDWQITNGEIMSGQWTNTILVHWFNSDTGIVSISEHSLSAPYCSAGASLIVYFSEDIAPDPAIIMAKDNDINTGILLCSGDPFTYYQWGYEDKATLNETIVKDSVDSWCLYGVINTTINYYWVKVKSNNSTTCPTKSYFNAPPVVYGTDDNDKDNKSSLTLYPNPNTGSFNIDFTSSEKGKVYISIKSILGEEVRSYIFNKPHEDFKELIDTGISAKGIYFIEIKLNNIVITKKLSIMN